MKQKGKRSLVVQHLEYVPGGAFKRFPDVIRELVHGRNGVYALYSGDRLYYVGLARDLRSRLKSHLRDRHADEWDKFSIYLTAGDEHMKELESLVLRIADPSGNRVTGKLAGSDDLRPLLRRRIRVLQQREFVEFTGGVVREAATPDARQRALAARRSEAALAPYTKKRFHIRLRHNDKQYIAHVRPDGTIAFSRESADWARLRREVYFSPSKAAEVAVGHGMNGWQAWHFWSTKGDLVPLDALRKGRAKPRF
jgi:hypothetical protein